MVTAYTPTMIPVLVQFILSHGRWNYYLICQNGVTKFLWVDSLFKNSKVLLCVCYPKWSTEENKKWGKEIIVQKIEIKLGKKKVNSKSLNVFSIGIWKNSKHTVIWEVIISVACET